MKWIFTLLLFSFSAQASDSLSLSFGPSLDGQLAVKKVFLLSYEKAWEGPSLELETGGWNEPNGVDGYVGANLGVHVVTEDGFSVRVGFGPSLITQTDDRLSSLFEFNISTKIGVQRKGWGGGFCFHHISDAGIVRPNPGFDYGCLYATIPL